MHYIRMTIGAALLKGVIMSAVLFAVGADFVQQVIVAAVSALLTGFFVLIAAGMAARAARQVRQETIRNRDEIQHVKRKIGAANRTEDVRET